MKTSLFRRRWFPDEGTSQLKFVDDEPESRRYFLERRPAALRRLLADRYGWCASHLGGRTDVLEVGARHGLVREFIDLPGLKLANLVKHPWIDYESGLFGEGLADGSFDAIICVHAMHHTAHPPKFFAEMRRILRPGGLLLIHDLQTTPLLRAVLTLTRHKGWSDDVDVFDPDEVCNRPEDPDSENLAMADLLFADHERFEANTPGWTIQSHDYAECFSFLTSGGVNSRTHSLRLPEFAYPVIEAIDRLLIRALPSVFGLSQRVVLQRD